MKTLKELETEIRKLEEEKSILEEQLSKAIKSAMIKVVNANKRQAFGDNSFLVKSSELLGNSWDPKFYNWEESIKVVWAFLETKEPLLWKNLLKEKLDSSKNKIDVAFKINSSRNSSYTCKINYKFIELIIEELDKQ